jgi:hypothetical protein
MLRMALGPNKTATNFLAQRNEDGAVALERPELGIQPIQQEPDRAPMQQQHQA